jgi:hypothetical protein
MTMNLDWEQLVKAMEAGDGGQYGIDPSLGTIRFFDRHELDSDGPDELLDTARYILVDPVLSRFFGEWLESFSETVDDSIGSALAKAARSRDPARAARPLLREQPAVRTAWRAYRRRRLEEEAEAWLEQQGIVPDNPPPWRA